MRKMILRLNLGADEWNKVCSLFDTYCNMAPQVVVPEIVPCVCVTLCHIMWKTDSVFNRDSNKFCAGVVEELGRWIIQQGYAKTVVPVTKNTIIQIEASILITLEWHLDPPTVTSTTQVILQRFMVLTKGRLASSAPDVRGATDKYVWKIIMSSAVTHYPIMKLARGAVALSLANAGLLPMQGKASIVPESAQNAWNDTCKLAFATETFLDDMVEIGRFLEPGRWTATSCNHGDSEVNPGRSQIQIAQI